MRDARDALRRLGPDVELHRSVVSWSPDLEAETGAGIRLALLDSGVAVHHPVFEGAWLEARDFSGSGGVDDPTGHGTRGAALLVGQDPRRVRGLVPAAALLVAKVLGPRGRVRGADAVARAIDVAVAWGADVVVMPIGRAPGSPRVVRAIGRARRAGCRLYAAAGNRGPDMLAFPARVRGVIAVSAVDDDGEPIAGCCRSGLVDIYAPGEAVWGLGDAPQRGTSPATILAAGVAALQLAHERGRRSGDTERREPDERTTTASTGPARNLAR